MQFLSLLIPIAYLGILIGSLATFSHLYRQRQIKSKLRLAPYFPTHTSRNVYLSLLHMQDSEDVKVPETVLRAALLARAVEDWQRIQEIRTRKPALAQLLQRGVVGDEIFQRLQRAETEIELEVKDVMNEANALAPNWGNHIFQSANEMLLNKMLRDKLEVVKATLPAEQEAWAAQREKSRRELEGDDVVAAAAAQEQQPQQRSTETSTPEKEKPLLKAGSSDEDGVMVETPAAEVAATAAGTGGSSANKSKKKKGKK
ncbi:Translocation protein S66 [Exophiala oligosperma]